MASLVRTAVVGVDGSPASVAARAWVATIADDLHEVHVADDDVAGAIMRTADEHGADLVAVGMHDQRRRVLRGLGPVVRTLLEKTTRPVVVVGEGQETTATTTTIVVGVGHGPATQAALRWAGLLARERTARLELVRAVPHRPVFRPDGLLDLMAFYLDPALAAEWAADDLETFAREVDRVTGEEVAVGWTVPSGRTGAVLVEASERAQLLVVGLHDRPGRDDRDVKPWCRHVLVHAPCPVVFVPA
jgi:nucleotide-binding universal stress UspA family protein